MQGFREVKRKFGLLFNPEDGGSMLPRNVGEVIRDYLASIPRR
jgi:hypothetical protein